MNKRYGSLIVSYIIFLIYILITLIYIFRSSFYRYSQSINIIVIIFLTFIFGSFFRYLQNRFNTNLRFNIINSIFITTIISISMTALIYTINELSKVIYFDHLDNMNSSWISPFIIDIHILIIILIFSFNIFYFFDLYKEKKYKPYFYYLAVLILNYIILGLIKFFIIY